MSLSRDGSPLLWSACTSFAVILCVYEREMPYQHRQRVHNSLPGLSMTNRRIATGFRRPLGWGSALDGGEVEVRYIDGQVPLCTSSQVYGSPGMTLRGGLYVCKGLVLFVSSFLSSSSFRFSSQPSQHIMHLLPTAFTLDGGRWTVDISKPYFRASARRNDFA